MNINYLKHGQLITRVSPSSTGDCSFIGDKFVFLQIANGCIHVYHAEPTYFANRITKLNLVKWSKGWEEYVTPNYIGKEEHIQQLLKNH